MITLFHEVAMLARRLNLLDEQKYKEYCIYEDYCNLKFNKNEKNVIFKISRKCSLSEIRIYKIIKKFKEVNNEY